eukprot:COSAG01_NODE_30809_length_609_cov_0.982353_1_plen_84_part_10
MDLDAADCTLGDVTGFLAARGYWPPTSVPRPPSQVSDGAVITGEVGRPPLLPPPPRPTPALGPGVAAWTDGGVAARRAAAWVAA